MTVSKNQVRNKSLIASSFALASVFLLALFIKNQAIASAAVGHALDICARLLIPSLFPIMIASHIAIESGVLEKLIRPFSGALSRIFGIKKEAAAPLALGFIGGYTASVSGAVALYKNNAISKSDCEKAIALSSAPSISFLTGFVGAGIFNNACVGWVLWGITIASSLILATVLKITEGSKRNAKSKSADAKEQFECKIQKSPFKIIVGAISTSASSMLIICACVVFFCALCAVICYPLDALGIPESLRALIIGCFEITNGVTSTSSISPISLRATACAFFVGWSGLSVHFQIISICEEHVISFKKYFLLKIASGLICSLLALIIL